MQLVFHRRTDEHANFAGFTLVELAVVIAMTGVLSALLLPALSSAKEKSRRAVCKSDQKQLGLACTMYANDNSDFLPSGADNYGNYHSILLSDDTFTNMVNSYAEGVSNIFYCPNLVFNSSSDNNIASHNSYGYTIGYSYLAARVIPSSKGAAEAVDAMKLSANSPTNKLLADANYWAEPGSSSSPLVKLAPHTSTGAAMAQASVTTAVEVTNSAAMGAMGGNVEFFDGSVTWRSISSMQTYSASSLSDAYGNW